MSRYRPYPAYKDSGIPWIGKVPEHWKVARLRYVAPFFNSNVDKKDYDGQQAVQLCNYTDVYNNEFVTSSLSFMEATASSEEISRFALHRGDVLMTKDSEDPADIGIPAYVTEDMPGVICGYHLTVIRSATADTGRYLQRSIQSHPTKAYFFVESPGITRYGLSQDAIGDTPVCVPPLAEQAAIATALDRETARIDALIAKKTRFIELLKEKRQALITRAVTKGLDPHATMKDSGVAWIGEVPTHWTVSPVKFVAAIGNGSTPSRERADYWENGSFPWLTSSCVNRESVTAAEEFVTPTAMTECHLPVVQPPAVLVGITGQGKTRGMATTLLVEATINQHIAFLKAREGRIRTQYLRSCIDVAYNWLRLNSEGAGSTKGAITCEQLGSLSVVLPSIEEQGEIVAALSERTGRMDRLAASTERSITLLKERRAALITAAVTGQIDLRDPAPSTEGIPCSP